jgi:hypothetical protein
MSTHCAISFVIIILSLTTEDSLFLSLQTGGGSNGSPPIGTNCCFFLIIIKHKNIIIPFILCPWIVTEHFANKLGLDSMVSEIHLLRIFGLYLRLN